MGLPHVQWETDVEKARLEWACFEINCRHSRKPSFDITIFFYKIASKLGVLIWTKSSSDTIFGHHHILSVLQSNCPKMLEAKTWSVGDAHDSSNLWKMHEITVDIIWLQKKAWVKTCVSSQRQCVLGFFTACAHTPSKIRGCSYIT